MMGALSHMPTQTGIASILAAIGSAPGTTGEDAGFEQLFAGLPTTADAAALPGAVPLPGKVTPVAIAAPQPSFEAVASAAIDLPVAADALPKAAAPAAILTEPAAPVAALPTAKALVATQAPALPVDAAPAPDSVVAVAPDKPAPVKKAAASETADDAAAAATLLIAVATPRGKAAPAAEAAPAATPVKDEADKVDAETPIAAPVAQAAPAAADATGVAHAIAVAAAPAQPALARVLVRTSEEKPAAEKPAKTAPAFAAPHRREADGQQVAAPVAPKANEAAPLLTGAAIGTEPKPAKPVVDTAAAITVLFAQPAAASAALVGEAAKAAPVTERTLDMTSDDQWIAQLAADIAATKSDKGDISFRLMPRHLGRLDVAMRMDGDSVSLRLNAQHEATATIVQAAQPRLVEDLRQQGVRVADAQVTHTAAETGRQSQQQGGQGRGAAADASHLIETAAERHDTETDERTADRRGRFA